MEFASISCIRIQVVFLHFAMDTLGSPELPELELTSSTVSPVGVRLLSTPGSAITLRRPQERHAPGMTFTPALRVIPGRPLDLEVDLVDSNFPCARKAASLAAFLSAQARLALRIIGGPHDGVSHVVPITVHASSAGWVARAVIHPSSWAGAESLMLESLELTGRALRLLLAGLPVTVEHGFSHDPAYAGAVYRAAEAGDVPALEAALAAGGSTEEKHEVSGAGTLARSTY